MLAALGILLIYGLGIIILLPAIALGGAIATVIFDKILDRFDCF